MGDGEKASLRLQFNPKVRLAFHGATITTDAGLLAFREFDDALGLTEIAEDYLQESRTGRNILHHLVPLLSPNPPKDTDGRREDSGRVGEGATGEMAGLHWGRLEVGGRSSVAA